MTTPTPEQHGPSAWADAPAGFVPSGLRSAGASGNGGGWHVPDDNHADTPRQGLDHAPRARRWGTNAAIIIGTFFSAALAASAVTPRMNHVSSGSTANDLSVVAFLASLAAATALCWRLRSLTALLISAGIACLPGLLLPTDSLPALIAMASVIVWHPDVRARVAVTAGAALTTFVAVWRDTRGTRDGTSFWNSLQHSDGSAGQWPPMPWWQVALITALLVTTFAGVAMIRRTRHDASQANARAKQAHAAAQRDAQRAHDAQVRAAQLADDERRARAHADAARAAAQQHADRERQARERAREMADRERQAQAEAQHSAAQAQHAQRQMDDLGRQLAEQDEREALAREVHDVLGHRLSILSMQANALEIEAQQANSQDVEERARQIQQGASGSMDDLRALLAMLRTGTSTPEHHDLADIADLVRECIDAGTPVSSNVFVDQTHPLDPVISASAYRIVTELLTNARKHAPGALVQLDIRGDAREGIVITTTNPLRADATVAGSTENARSGDAGTGLMGVAKRAGAVGGFFEAGASPDGARFVATARLPWVLPGRTQTPLR